MTKIIIQVKDGEIIAIGANTDQVMIKVMDMDDIETSSCVIPYDHLEYGGPDITDFDIDHVMRNEWDQAWKESDYDDEDCYGNEDLNLT